MLDFLEKKLLKMNYVEYYKNHPANLETDYQKALNALNTGSNITVISLPGMADSRFIDYIHYRTQESKTPYQSMLIVADEFDEAELEKNVQMSKQKFLVLVPHFDVYYQNLSQKLLKIQHKYKDRGVQIVSKGSLDFVLNPHKYSDLAGILGQSFQRTPLASATEVETYLNERKNLHNWNFAVTSALSKKVFSLSGGNFRLAKRIGNFLNNYPNSMLEANELLTEPGISLIVSEIVQSYPNLNEIDLIDFGLTNKELKVRSSLVEYSLQKENYAKKEKLSHKLRVLFNLLYENRDKLVTLEQIDDCLRGKFDSSNWANYKLVSRLKKALIGKYEIRTVAGKGYILESIS